MTTNWPSINQELIKRLSLLFELKIIQKTEYGESCYPIDLIDQIDNPFGAMGHLKNPLPYLYVFIFFCGGYIDDLGEDNQPHFTLDCRDDYDELDSAIVKMDGTIDYNLGIKWEDETENALLSLVAQINQLFHKNSLLMNNK